MLKICSLLPAATEIACAIGLRDSLVAVSHECDYPADVKGLPKITKPILDVKSLSSLQVDEVVRDRISKGLSLYEINLELLRELSPDLILTQDLCRVCAVSSGEIHREVRRIGLRARILPLDARNMREVLESIMTLGEFTDKKNQARELVQNLRAKSEMTIDRTLGIENRPKAVCLDWVHPPFVAGHWVPEMTYIAGAFDGLGVPGTPSRPVSWNEVADYNPKYIFIMPCGFDTQQSLEEAKKLFAVSEMQQTEAVKSGRVFAMDANSLFSRPGPRLFEGLRIMAKVLHPTLFGELDVEEHAFSAKAA